MHLLLPWCILKSWIHFYCQNDASHVALLQYINPADALLLRLLLFLSWLHITQPQEVTWVWKEYKTGRSIRGSERAVTIVLADKHTGQGRCRRVPAGELPINTRALSLTWRLAPDEKTETERAQEQTRGVEFILSEGDMKTRLHKCTKGTERMRSFHWKEELCGDRFKHLHFSHMDGLPWITPVFSFSLDCLEPRRSDGG